MSHASQVTEEQKIARHNAARAAQIEELGIVCKHIGLCPIGQEEVGGEIFAAASPVSDAASKSLHGVLSVCCDGSPLIYAAICAKCSDDGQGHPFDTTLRLHPQC